jgi:DNA mismatch repair ATPase MutS
MQVGSFYELYGYSDKGADVDSVCNLLDIVSTRKKKSITTVDRLNPKMAGIPLFVLDKYMDILLDDGCTIILVEQTTPPPEPKREVTRIISPATREIDNSVENNYLMCLYITTGSMNNSKFLIGSMSYVDVNTNHSYIFLCQMQKINQTKVSVVGRGNQSLSVVLGQQIYFLVSWMKHVCTLFE